MSSTNNTSNDSKPKDDAPASVAAHGGGESAKAPAPVTVTKTVHTVEVKESAGQDQVLKPTKVVHHIPADQAKETAKQD